MAGLCLALGLALGGGCSEDEPSPAPAPRVQERQDLASAVLSDLQRAIADGDASRAGSLAAEDPEAEHRLESVISNAQDLRVRDFTLRYIDVDGVLTADLPDDQWAAAVDASWAFGGFDREPARTEITVTFELDGKRAGIVSFGGGERVTPLWLTDRLQVRRSAVALVMLADGSTRSLTTYTRLANAAVPVVRRVLPDWRSGLVVEIPGSSAQLDDVLGAQPGEYGAVAAVTAAADGSLAPTAPIHVFINPEVSGGLRKVGAQVVMSHEAAHVATRAVSSGVALWLLEGFADYVALRDVDLPLSRTAGQILDQVRRDGAPAALPGPAEFNTRTTHLGAAYEAAWLACRLLARIGGEDALVDLYRRVSRGATVDAALNRTFGFGEKEFTRKWREELRSLAG